MSAPDKPQVVWELTPARPAQSGPGKAEPYRVQATPAAISCAACLIWVVFAVAFAAFVMWQIWLGR
jgi:hypothetical protein